MALGVLVGGIVGVIFSVLAFSAFLFQLLEALRDAIVALATVVLAIATISLYRATSVLGRSTGVLAEVETKRDRRVNLEERISLGERLTRIDPNFIVGSLRGTTTQYSKMTDLEFSVRRLRRLISYEEAKTDDEVFRITPLLDQLIAKFDINANVGAKALKDLKEDALVTTSVEQIQALLKILVTRWEGQVPFLFE